MKIYIGGRISGLTYEEASTYFDTTKSELEKMGYFVFSPMTAKDALRTEIKLKSTGYGNPVATNHAIYERDQWCVRQADVFYLNLMACGNNFVSMGGVTELAWASLLGKHTVVAMQEDNIHRHTFILEGADVVFTNHVECMRYLRKLIKQRG